MLRGRRPRWLLAIVVVAALVAGALAVEDTSVRTAADASVAVAPHGASPALSALSAATADAAVGLRIPYYQPPSTADPATPGTTISSGADQPDPFMTEVHGRYYLFTSQDRVPADVPVRSGTTIGRWGPMTDALPDLPAWAVPGYTWAPDVHQFGSHYLLYFTAALNSPTAHVECIGAAISTRVDGPYLAATGSPFICQLADGGSIDPRTFVDADGTAYMIWKSDQNSDTNGTERTSIYSQRLSPDGEHLLGQPTRIFGPDEAWQGRIVEAPDLVLVRGQYELFYSGAWFNQPGYAIGVARCAGPLGPCADTSPTPLLDSNAQGVGPGEESVFADLGGYWLLYSPFRSTLPLPGPPRPVEMVRLGFGLAGPYLASTGSG